VTQQPSGVGDTVSKTVIVVLTVVGLVCVLPCLLCLITGTLGNLLPK
jgi:hypothetical protein